MIKLAIPHAKQETDYYCGPAMVQMILARRGIGMSQEELASILGTDLRGTPVASIENYLTESGYKVTRKNDASWEDLEDALGRGDIVVVGFLEPRENEAHYAIVATMTGRDIFMHDPLQADASIFAREEFERRWRDDKDHAYGDRMMLAIKEPARV